MFYAIVLDSFLKKLTTKNRLGYKHAYNTLLLTNYIKQVYKRQNNIISVLRNNEFYSVSIMQTDNSNKINNDDKFTINS